jgi:hypothetical protein
MGNALTRANGPAAPAALPSVPAAQDPIALGQVLAQSGYFADARQAAQAAVKVLAGQELGLGPIAAMTGIHIVQGKVTLGANLIAALIRKSGRYDYRVAELTDLVCRIEFTDGEAVAGESSFSMDDAKRAGLLGKPGPWQAHPRNMLFARAMSNGAKWFCPEIFAGAPIYTPDELGAQVDSDGEVVAAPAAPAPAAPLPPTEAQVAELGELLGLLAQRDPETDWSKRLDDYVAQKFPGVGADQLDREQVAQVIHKMRGVLALVEATPKDDA